MNINYWLVLIAVFLNVILIRKCFYELLKENVKFIWAIGWLLVTSAIFLISAGYELYKIITGVHNNVSGILLIFYLLCLAIQAAVCYIHTKGH